MPSRPGGLNIQETERRSWGQAIKVDWWKMAKRQAQQETPPQKLKWGVAEEIDINFMPTHTFPYTSVADRYTLIHVNTHGFSIHTHTLSDLSKLIHVNIHTRNTHTHTLRIFSSSSNEARQGQFIGSKAVLAKGCRAPMSVEDAI